MAKVLITTDLHFSDRPNAEYRWDVVHWLAQAIEKHGVTHLFILGDLTDDKDHHSAALVKQVMGAFDMLLLGNEGWQPSPTLEQVIILKGNHDYIDPDNPFFFFLRSIWPSVHFVIHSQTWNDGEWLFLPHTRHPETDWAREQIVKWIGEARYIFCHQTFTGGVSQDGYPMEGSSYEQLIRPHNGDALVFSGDLHKQQVIGDRVHYVGSPYPTTFQRTRHNGRFVLLDTEKGGMEDIKVEMGQRVSIVANLNDGHGLHRLLEDNWAHDGDILKITVNSDDTSVHKWFDYKKALLEQAREEGVDVASIELRLVAADAEDAVERQQVRHTSPAERLEQYCSEREVPDDMAIIGKAILTQAMEE